MSHLLRISLLSLASLCLTGSAFAESNSPLVSLATATQVRRLAPPSLSPRSRAPFSSSSSVRSSGRRTNTSSRQTSRRPVASAASSKASIGSSGILPTSPFPLSFPITQDWQTKWKLHQVEGTAESLVNAEYREEADAKIGSFLRIHFPQNTSTRAKWKFEQKTLGGMYAWVDSGTPGAREMYLRYFVRFPSTIDLQRPGELPGLLTGQAHPVGNQSLGMSVVTWDKGMLKLMLDATVPAKSVKFNEKAGAIPQDGAWHRIDLHVRLQSGPGRLDGLAEAWLDGHKFALIDDVLFHNRTQDVWDGFALWASYDNLSTYTAPRQATFLDLAGFTLSATPFPELKDIAKPMK